MKEKIMEYILNLENQGIDVKINEDQINDLVDKIFDKKDEKKAIAEAKEETKEEKKNKSIKKFYTKKTNIL